MNLRLSAYVLAADPAYLAASVSSYLPIVDRVLISFDREHKSWSGRPIPVDECLRELASLDVDDKLTFHPGDFSRPELSPMACETLQRQDALDVASRDADWVLQLDSDEVAPDPQLLRETVENAAASGADGLEYPSRWLYARVADSTYLEQCGRWWQSAASYPGCMAVRRGTRLTVARQIDGRLYRADFRSRNTDPWHPRNATVDQAVPLEGGLLHFSWVRSDEEMEEKARTSGHRDDLNWQRELRDWRSRRAHPLRAVAATPLRRRERHGWLRLATLRNGAHARAVVGA